MSPYALAVVVPDEAAGASLSPGSLPPGWCLSTLGKVASINPATAFDGLANDAEIPFIPMTAVAEETGIIDASRRRSVAEIRKGYVRFCEGDVIFAKITPCMENGKTAPVIGMPGGYAAGSTEFHVLRPEAVEPRYLWYWLVRHAFRHEAQRNMSGSAGQLRVPVDYLRKSRISVAPLAEQRRIVTRIDELFAEIAEGETALQRARQGLDTWRRALLKAAVAGELTRDWREANRPAETGADLLARIRAESSGRKLRKGRTPSEAFNRNSLPELPAGWVWSRLGEIVSDTLVGLDRNAAAQHKGPNGTPYIKMNNISMDGVVDTKRLVRTSVSPAEATRYKILSGDVLFNTRNSRELVGKTGMVRDITEDTVFNNNVLRLRFFHRINPEFINFQICSPIFRKHLEVVKRATTNVAAVYQGDLLTLPIAVPSTAEQTEIVLALKFHTDKASDAVDLIERANSIDRVALHQSILKAAFEGRLVAQDPTDEPASALLAHPRDSHAGHGSRRRNARTAADFSHPSLPGLTDNPWTRGSEPAGDE